MQPKIVASIEARMNSSRLPGKMMTEICGKPTIERVVRRLEKCVNLNDIIIATTSLKNDDVLANWAEQNNINYYRGSENDVLERVVKAHQTMSTDIIVEITGDCPLIDPEIIDLAIDTFCLHDYDVVNNIHSASYPPGTDVQVYWMSGLEKIEKTIYDPAVREHVSLYFYENPDKYKIHNLVAPKRWNGPELRFQLDYPEDLEFIRSIYSELLSDYDDNFGIEEIMNLLSKKPEIKNINSHCEEKPAR